jgi:DNA repair protein RadC
MPRFRTHTVATIKLVQASAVRLTRAETVEQPVLTNSDRLVNHLMPWWRGRKSSVSEFNRNRLLASEAQGRGTVNHTPVAAPHSLLSVTGELLRESRRDFLNQQPAA